MMRSTALAVLLASASLPALASTAAGEVACRPDGTQMELNACAADGLAAAQAALDATWEQVLRTAGSDAVAVERLQAAQRLWQQLLQADLAAQFPLGEGQNASIQYGSTYPMSLALARAELVRQRTAYLRVQFLADDR